MNRQSPTKHPYQRGAIGLAGVFTLLMALLFTALVVDSGRLWMQQRKLQSIADIAAIDASRHLGCNSNLQNVIEIAQQSAVNNGFDGQLSENPNQVLLGSLDTVQGVRHFTADGKSEAIYIKATKEVASSLILGGLMGGNVTLYAEAVSVSDPSLAAFSAGSFTASLNTDQSVLLNGLLGGMLGSPLNLDVLAYSGIAGVKIRLQDILAVSGQVGTLEDLLNTDMQIADLLELLVNAAGQSGLADIQAIAAMQTIVDHTVSNATIKLGEVLAVTTPDTNTAASVALNALSLITTAAMVANSTNAITLPLGINLPSITNINTQISIIEPPQIALGPAASNGNICTTVRTAQIRTRVGVLINIPLLASIDLALNAEVAQGAAELSSIQQNDSVTKVEIEATPGVAALTLTNNAGTGPARISTLLNIPVADIGLNLPIQSPVTQTLEYSIPHPIEDNLPQTQSISSPLGGSLANALGQSNSLDITVLGILNLGLLNTVVSTIVSPLLSEIGRVLLDPLLNLLGIRLGGMDVTLDDVQYRQSKPLVI
jgi:uncharacterized membrane protein